jgi:hypothetical protein
MIPKSVKPFSEKIILKQEAKAATDRQRGKSSASISLRES